MINSDINSVATVFLIWGILGESEYIMGCNLDSVLGNCSDGAVQGILCPCVR